MPSKNQFFGINKFPKGWGIIIMGISMSRIATGQSAQKCIEWVLSLNEKIAEPKVGLNFVYGHFLYLYSDEKASDLKKLYMNEIIKHKNAMQKLIIKNPRNLQIRQAFTYQTWNDLYLNTKDFSGNLLALRKLYDEDKNFKKYIDEDITHYGREITENQIGFFVEEHLMMYLILYKQVTLRNEYVTGREEWIIEVYPGTPPKALIYLFQKNPFKFKTNNPYLGQYNLENSKFYDFSNIDLETWNYK